MAVTQSTCLVDTCEKPAKNGGMCWTHYGRKRKYGSTEPLVISCATCSAAIVRDGKTGPIPKFCSERCRRLSRRKPGPVDGKCEGCGGKIERPNTLRNIRYCHPHCRALKHRSPARPRESSCTQCGAAITFAGRDSSGALHRNQASRRCSSCAARVRPHRYGMTAKQVADRDGTICRWCNEEVDFSLVGTRTKWAPSVDHVIPWSRGGTNGPANLQLLHRVCNAEKGTQVL